MRYVPLFCILALTLGCEGFRLEASCPDGTSPDFDNDALNCGGCGITCEFARGFGACEARQCVLRECETGWDNRDRRAENGCECFVDPAIEGACTDALCSDAERAHNGLDDDCDGIVDEGSPVDTRAHCGAPHRSCLIPAGALDVDCVDGACVPVGRDEGALEPPGAGCWDAVDDDGNGVRDDGPHCEVLLPAVPHLDCRGREPQGRCQPAIFSMGHGADGRIAHTEYPLHDVALTYDVLFDRYEATRGQFAAYLAAAGKCEDDDTDPRCAVPEPDALRPASGITWCEAYDYCQWMGKRMPTEAEWARLAGGTDSWSRDKRPYPFTGQPSTWTPDDGSGIDAPPSQLESSFAPCEHSAVVIPVCQTDGVDQTRSVAETGGRRLVGDVGPQCLHPRERGEPLPPEQACLDREASVVNHVAGNVWEWVFDARIMYCDRYAAETGRPCRPGLLDTADDPLLRRETGLIVDPVHAGRRDREQRLLRGGGFAAEPDSIRTFNRLMVQPGIRQLSYGVRCARTFMPDAPEQADAHPYDRRRASGEWAICADTPPLEPRPARAIEKVSDICVPELVENDQAAYGDAIELTVRGAIASPNTAYVLAEDTVDPPRRLLLGHAHRADDAWWWLAGGHRAGGTILCEAGHCRIELDPDPSLSIYWPASGTHALVFDVDSVETRPMAENQCGWRADREGTLWRVSVAVRSDSSLRFNDQGVAQLVCDNLILECTEPVGEGRAACRECPSWRMTFDLLTTAIAPAEVE